MFRKKTAQQHNFAVIPGADVPRSVFRMLQTRKQAFDASDLIPIMCEEVLPGDTWRHEESMAARLATPIAPVVDNLDIETAYFFVPNRITANTLPGGSLGANTANNEWEALITGADNLTLPLITPTIDTGTWPVPVGSVFDHFGIPSGIYTTQLAINALPIWAYFMIYNEWIRDENLQDPYTWSNSYSSTNQASDIAADDVGAWDMMPLRINKRSDYFTRSLPFAQKGSPVLLPLGTTAPVITNNTAPLFTVAGNAWPGPVTQSGLATLATSAAVQWDEGAAGNTAGPMLFGTNTGLVTDLSAATSATINAIRLAAVTQQILERDARGGSRYVENLLATWGVRSPDYRLQRPEYLGGSKIPVTVNPVAQTAAYDAEPADTASAVGNLGAEMHASGSSRTFTYAATEHGYIIGLAWARATPTYQQGMRRHWIARHTRFDFWDPKFANLGEQAVDTREIFNPLDNTPATATWGYQEQGAEYRYTPNEITGVLRSTAAQPLDWWHYAEEFSAEPALNGDFITDKTKETLARSLATAPSAQWSAQIIMDIEHNSTVARIMPAYSVPGIDKL